MTYTAKDPLVLGVGMAATRDVISFFRAAAKDDAGTANPLASASGYRSNNTVIKSGEIVDLGKLTREPLISNQKSLSSN